MTVPAPLPPTETERLAALRRYAILDSAPDPMLDRIVRFAAKQFKMPIALVSLVDQDRQWFQSVCGLNTKETGRDVAFCGHAILQDEVFVIPDACQDWRFAKNPLVTGEPHIRFYAGAPLINPQGHALGALCLVDREPHHDFSDDDRSALQDLAVMVADHIDMRYTAGDVLREVEARIEVENSLAAAEHRLSLFFEYLPVSVAVFDTEMRYLAASRHWCESFELDSSTLMGRSHHEVMSHIPSAWHEQYARCLQGESADIEEDTLPKPDGGFEWVRRQIRPWRNRHGEIGGLVIFREVITKRKQMEAELHRNQSFLEAVLESVQDGIVACNAEGQLSFFNKSACRITGLEMKPLMPEDWVDTYSLLDPDGQTPIAFEKTPLFRAFQGETVENQELIIAPDGLPQRWVVCQSSPLYDEAGVKLGAVASMHDVTAQREAEKSFESALEEVRQREAHLRIITNNLPFLITYTDEHLNYRFINRTGAAWYAVAQKDIVGSNAAEILGVENFARLKPYLERARYGVKSTFEATVDYPDGVRRDIQCVYVPDFDDEGEVQGVIAIALDITEQKRVANRLISEQKQLALILDNVPVRIFYKDDKNRILRANQPAAQSTGLTVEEIEGANAFDLFPRMAKKYHQDDLEVIRSGKPKLGIMEEIQMKDGERRWIRTDKVPYTDGDTGERFVFVAGSDITAEKLAEERLRASEERYRSLYTKTPVMLHSIDADGRLVSVSDLWLERMGYSKDEVIGRQARDFMTPESARDAAEQSMPQFFRDGFCTNVEYQFVTKSGEVLDILLSAVAEYDEAGTPTRSMAVLNDITERKIVERQLAQSQKMETVGQLTGGLAHDFNNLLGVVLGNLQLLQRSVGADEKATRRIEAAVKAVDRGAELNRRLLAFSRRQKLETEIVDANPLVEGLSDMLTRTLGESIALECRLGARIPCIRTDPSQLESAILNLAVNARDAMSDGGRLTIETAAVHLDEDDAAREHEVEAGDYVMLSVTDSGCGIAADKIDKVFEPFFTTKEVGKGSGLGLSMVYGFIKQTGGHVRVYSELGRGTTIRLYMPVANCSSHNRSSAMELETVIESGHETVLVVEDQADVREMAVGLLEDLGYSVREAENGREALAVLNEHEDIDLVFTDIVMPGGMDGTQVAKAARRLRPDLPVLYATGYAEAAVLREGDVRATDNLVTKPYRREDLAVKIRQAFREQTASPGETSVPVAALHDS